MEAPLFPQTDTDWPADSLVFFPRAEAVYIVVYGTYKLEESAQDQSEAQKPHNDVRASVWYFVQMRGMVLGA